MSRASVLDPTIGAPPIAKPHREPSTPFSLPAIKPDRTIPQKGDVIYSPHHNESHLYLKSRTERGFNAQYLTGIDASTEIHLSDSDIDYLTDNNLINIVAERVNSIAELWWLTDPSTFNIDTGPISARSPDDVLEWHRDRDMTGVNAFLDHPLVDHGLGSVHVWKVAFTATYNGHRVAVAILSRPAAPELDDSSIITLSRFAAHPRRPQNTASWLLAKARRWAELEGYDELRTYAGVSNDNNGTIYQASNFELDEITEADGSGWQNRDGRSSWNDYTRRRYIYTLNSLSRPVPSQNTSQQTTLTAPATDTNTKSTTARLDHINPKTLAAIASEYPQPSPTSSVPDNADAIFGMANGATINAIVPVTTNCDTRTAKIESISINADEFDYPENEATRILAKIREWSELEGIDTLRCTDETPFAKRVCSQANITQ